ncbi:hypothetical protein AX17_003523 [Amanita inopinata Kibby_2008]|nr:hypothetical protein AX17_003523 [Amanita inopinata Kibby_2008]
MPTFDIVVVGSGGGPDELDLSAYLLKESNAEWSDGILGLEAGSSLGALKRILERNPSLFQGQKDSGKATHTAPEIYSYVKCFLITHAHLDHISGLVLSAGSLPGSRKRVYGLQATLDNISSVFNGRLWPRLASFDEQDDQHKLLLCPLRPNHSYISIHSSISVLPLPVSHGVSSQDPCEPVISTAFFIRHDPSQREILFFGDVEPDALSSNPLNHVIWRIAASKIPHTLSAIFIECSWTLDRSDDMLFGHLNPTHLVNELVALALEVHHYRASQTASPSPPRKRSKIIPEETMSTNVVHPEIALKKARGALDGLTVYITHFKSDFTSDRAVRDTIVEQVNSLVQDKDLGARVLSAQQGSLIRI